MGVYINMEMPIRCAECLLAKLSPTGKSLICNYMLSRVPWDERPFDCPLVPVPPHGRLIDGDRLDAYLKNAATMADGEAKEAYIDARAEARTMPVIIPAEEGE